MPVRCHPYPAGIRRTSWDSPEYTARAPPRSAEGLPRTAYQSYTGIQSDSDTAEPDIHWLPCLLHTRKGRDPGCPCVPSYPAAGPP